MRDRLRAIAGRADAIWHLTCARSRDRDGFRYSRISMYEAPLPRVFAVPGTAFFLLGPGPSQAAPALRNLINKEHIE